MPRITNIKEMILIHEELVTLHKSIATKSKDQQFAERHNELVEILQATITELYALKGRIRANLA